jgi:hypothetical protein
MSPNSENSTSLPRDLGDGLILRRSTPEDAATLGAFNARIHSDIGPDTPDPRVEAWTRDLLERPHPTFGVGDYTIVEDTRMRQIVSSLNLISQTWSYGGIPFKLGRPELVGTLPEYRNRGLVRIQFEEMHRWSAARGELVQAITGIPYYYRLFGYEMALGLFGGRAGYPAHIPILSENETDPYLIRPAQETDLPFIAGLYQQSCSRYPVACVWTPEMWQYELKGKCAQNVNRSELYLIQSVSGEAVGFLATPGFAWGGLMPATRFEIVPGYSWAQVTLSVIRFLRAAFETHPNEAGGEKKPFEGFGFYLGEDHPVYHAVPNRLPRQRKPYAWYLRVADIPGFLRHVSPVLEQRMARSVCAGYSGQVRITFYHDGVRLLFENGRLATVEPWQPTPQGHSGEAAFPGLTFLQLLFGFRSLEEIRYAFPDCWADNEWAGGGPISVLLDAIFPRQPSDVWPIA